MPQRPTATFDCPNCGEDVPAGALACPECGSDDETGWSEDTAYDGLDLPGDYDSYEPLDTHAPSWKRGVFIVTASLLLIAFFWFLSLGGRLW